MNAVVLSGKAKRDIIRLKTENAKLAGKLWELVLNIMETHYEGLGKPEGLKGDLQGWWSRRIDQEHRLVYRVKDGTIEIASCYGHYGDK